MPRWNDPRWQIVYGTVSRRGASHRASFLQDASGDLKTVSPDVFRDPTKGLHVS
jgi:hypothetical protein